MGLSDNSRSRSTFDFAVKEDLEAQRRFMASQACFARVVRTADGRKAILVAGQVINVEPQDSVEWLVAALQGAKDDDVSSHPSSAAMPDLSSTATEASDLKRRVSAVEALLVAVNPWDVNAGASHPMRRPVDEPAAFLRFVASLQKAGS